MQKPKDANEAAVWGVNPDDGFAVELDDETRGILEKRMDRFNASDRVKTKEGDHRDVALDRAIEYLKHR